MNAAPDTYPPGTMISDRYRVEEVLGIGGFGAVYKCTQLNMDQIVAVKVLKMEHITSEEHVRRFEREARAASRLRHPNTISMFDFGKHTDGALFLAMEYLEGETLAERLDTGTTLAADDLVHIMAQVCHSLTEAHESNLVHRDLKPENIMLMSVAGDVNFVKVLDFGIAKVDDEYSAREERLTEMGMIMGTPTYMSPEQAYGKVLDARSDIYALGVLMYECLTGRVPFEGDKPMEVLVKHINNPPAPPRSLVPDLAIPMALEKAVLRCLEKKPEDRPQTTLALAIALEKALKTPDSALLKGRPDAPTGTDSDFETTQHVPELAEQTTAVAADGIRRASSAAGSGQRASKTLWVGISAFAVVLIVAFAAALLIPRAPVVDAAESQNGGRSEDAARRAVANGAQSNKPAPNADAQAAGSARTDPAKLAKSAQNPTNSEAAIVDTAGARSAAAIIGAARAAGTGAAPAAGTAGAAGAETAGSPKPTTPAAAVVTQAAGAKAALAPAGARDKKVRRTRRARTKAAATGKPSRDTGAAAATDTPPAPSPGDKKPVNRDDFRLDD